MPRWRAEDDGEELLPGEPDPNPYQVMFPAAATRVKSIKFHHQVARALVSLELPAGLMAFSIALHSIIATNLYLDKVALHNICLV